MVEAEKSYDVGRARREGTYKITQTEKWTAIGLGCLLAEQWEGCSFYQEVISVCICLAKPEDAMDGDCFVQSAEHSIGFLEELHGFGSFGTFLLGKGCQPKCTAGIAAMDVGYSRKARLEAPGMEEINPVDVRGLLHESDTKAIHAPVPVLSFSSHLILNP